MAPKYKIVSDTDVNELTDKINKELKKGWTLYGTFKTVSTEFRVIYMQPMIFEDGNEKIKDTEEYTIHDILLKYLTEGLTDDK